MEIQALILTYKAPHIAVLLYYYGCITECKALVM